MNLKELVHAQSHLLQHRHGEADLLCKQAYYLIAEAEAGEFANKELLKQALHLFTQAARQQRRASEPYLGLAYLAVLLEQQAQARRYLQTVLALAPAHQDATQLLNYLEQAPAAAPALTFGIPAAGGAQPVDMDQLHEQIERQLYDFARSLMQQAPPQASFETEALQSLRNTTALLAEQIQVFESQIVQLESEFDTADLRRRLRPAEAIYQRYQTALDSSENQAALHAEILSLIDSVRQLFGQCASQQPGSRAAVETELESIMDRCDWLADRLDELGTTQTLETLEYRYHALVAMIEQVKEKWDEHTGS